MSLSYALTPVTMRAVKKTLLAQVASVMNNLIFLNNIK